MWASMGRPWMRVAVPLISGCDDSPRGELSKIAERSAMSFLLWVVERDDRAAVERDGLLGVAEEEVPLGPATVGLARSGAAVRECHGRPEACRVRLPRAPRNGCGDAGAGGGGAPPAGVGGRRGRAGRRLGTGGGEGGVRGARGGGA